MGGGEGGGAELRQVVKYNNNTKYTSKLNVEKVLTHLINVSWHAAKETTSCREEEDHRGDLRML